MKTLFICFDEDGVKHLQNKIIVENNKVVIAAYLSAQNKLRELGIKFSEVEKYRKYNQTSQEEALKITQNIIRKIDEKYKLQHAHTRIAELFEIDIAIMTHEKYLKTIALVKNAIKDEKPSKLVCYSTDKRERRIVTEIAKQFDVFLELTGVETKEKRVSQNNLINLPLKIARSIVPIPKKEHVTFIVREAKRMLPIMIEQRKEGKNVLAIAIGTTTQAELLKKGFCVRTIEEILSKKELHEAKKTGERKALAWQKIHNDKTITNSVNFEGINLWKILEPDLQQFFSNQLPQTIAYIEAAKKLCENTTCFVMLTEETPLEKAIANEANTLGIPSIVVLHGNPAGILGVKAKHSILAAWGTSTKKYLVKHGNKSNKIIVTGQPYFDSIKILSKKEARKRLGLPQDKKIVLIGTTGGAKEENERLLKMTLPHLQKKQQVLAIIKIHYGENKEEYEKLLQKTTNAIILSTVPLEPLLRACDVVITVNSTIGLEAMIQGATVVQADVLYEENKVPYAKDEAAYYLTKKNQANIIETALKKPKPKWLVEKFIDKYAGKLDQNATKRVSQLINKASNKT